MMHGRKNINKSNFMKICPVRFEFSADGRTDMTKLTFDLRN